MRGKGGEEKMVGTKGEAPNNNTQISNLPCRQAGKFEMQKKENTKRE
jgi:hypothetical protein